MNRVISKVLLTGMVLSIAFGAAVGRIGDKQMVKKKLARKVEPAPSQVVEHSSTIPHTTYDLRNGSVFTLVDSSQNGYGLVASQTRPIYGNDEGWIIAYRQFQGAGQTHGRLGAAFSEDAINWAQPYANINAGMGMARYPSTLGNEDFPFVFWNEYTSETNTDGYGGRPFFTYDGLGWDYGSFEDPVEVDLTWSPDKDHWVGSPSYSTDGDVEYFNVVYNDWTRNNPYLFHSEAYEDGLIIFGQEEIVIDEQSDLVPGDATGSFNTSPTLSMNDDGIGMMGIVGFFATDANGVNCDPSLEAPGDCFHTPIFKMTYDHGTNWSDYYSVTNDVWQDVITNFDDYYDPCADTSQAMTDAWSFYDFDAKVDAAGNPHFVVSVLPGDEYGFSYYSNGDGSDNGSGFYHFTIDRNYLDNPGPVNTPTGWNYSRVVSGHDTFPYSSPDGETLAWMVQPSLAFSKDNEDIVWVVTNMMVPGCADEATVDPNDPYDCAPDAVFDSFPEASKEILVSKSVDGGQTWWNPLNATNSPDETNGGVDCPVNITTAGWCSPEEQYPHAFQWGDDDRVYYMFQRPNWEFNEIGDPMGADHMNFVYAGFSEVTSNTEPDYPEECSGCGTPGDASGDGIVNVLDIVGIVNYVLGVSTTIGQECAADFSGDGIVNVLDIVGIVNCILGTGSCDGAGALSRTNDASSASVVRNSNQLILAADGYVGGIHMTIAHDSDFTFELVDGDVAEFATKANQTTIIIVNPKDDVLLIGEGEFSLTNIQVTNSADFIDVAQVNKFALMSAYPNPFNPETTISYELYSNGNVSLAVYNMLGQQVNTLVSGMVDAGSYTAVWNGLDNSGSEMPSGIYMLKLVTENEIVTNKVTLLR